MWGCSERFPFAICSFFLSQVLFPFFPLFFGVCKFLCNFFGSTAIRFLILKTCWLRVLQPVPPFLPADSPLNRQPFRRTTCPLIESRTSLSGKPIKQVELFIGKERRIERNKKRGPHRKAHKSCAWYTTKWGNGATRLIMLTFCRTADSLLFC